MTSATVIDFSAQFGGPDAANAVLPVFKALKAAARGITIQRFPLPKLAYVLRVDGEVHTYGLSGAGDIELDENDRYMSIDIGITTLDCQPLQEADRSAVVLAALVSTVDLPRGLGDERLASADFGELDQALRLLWQRYEQEVRRETTSS